MAKNSGKGSLRTRTSIDDNESDTNTSVLKSASNDNTNGGNKIQDENVNGNTDLEKESRTLKKLKLGGMKFMSNFDPELSNREKRKLSRKLNNEGGGGGTGGGWKKSSLYDENGVLRGTGKDICDCLSEECPGCHFPCPKCRSCKCGHECRVNRKWMYETIENEADKVVIKNNILSN